MDQFDDEYEDKIPKKDKSEHPDFAVEQLGNKFESLYEVWMVDFTTQERKESFGAFDQWWKAEREARHLQSWADAENF